MKLIVLREILLVGLDPSTGLGDVDWILLNYLPTYGLSEGRPEMFIGLLVDGLRTAISPLDPVPPPVDISLGQLHQRQRSQPGDVWDFTTRLQRLSNPVPRHPPVILQS
nr:hypothetical protein [Corynebacterium antarcticum]